jgi:hypothetical protein
MEEFAMKINRNVVIGVVVVVVIGLIALAAINGPVLWAQILRLHGMR